MRNIQTFIFIEVNRTKDQHKLNIVDKSWSSISDIHAIYLLIW